jgi:hypothetical protein
MSYDSTADNRAIVAQLEIARLKEARKKGARLAKLPECWGGRLVAVGAAIKIWENEAESFGVKKPEEPTPHPGPLPSHPMGADPEGFRGRAEKTNGTTCDIMSRFVSRFNQPR